MKIASALPTLVLIAVAAPAVFAAQAAESTVLSVFAAGTLAVPFKAINAMFEEANPGVTVQAQYGGSVKMAKQITELHQDADVLAVRLRAAVSACPVAAGTTVRLAIRAEEVAIAPAAGGPLERNRLTGTVTAVRELGPLASIDVDCGVAGRAYLLAPQARAMKLYAGDAVTLAIAPEAIHVMAA